MGEGRRSGCAIATRGAVAVAILITAAAAVLGGNAAADTSKSASKGFKHCGTKTLYGKALDIRVKGEMRSCQRVQRIVRGKCKIRRRHWSCFSFRTPYPPLVWFRSKELFDRRWSTVIEAGRYPCAEATLTSEDWNGRSREFPTRKQILSDDLIRCDLLDGMTIDEVEAILGKSDGHGAEHGHPYRDYYVGPERDSFFQIDSEVLSIRFTSNGIFLGASIYQS